MKDLLNALPVTVTHSEDERMQRILAGLRQRVVIRDLGRFAFGAMGRALVGLAALGFGLMGIGKRQ